MDFAIVGLPQSGKTTLFHALTAGHGSAAAGTGQELLGAVKIPDDRLDQLAVLVKAKKITPLEMRLHDLPPIFSIAKGPSGTAAEALGKAEALILVVQAFEPHASGSVDTARDITAFDSELMFSDLAIVERRLDKIETSMRSGKMQERESAEREKALLERVKGYLEADTPLRTAITDPADEAALSNYGLLSLKPMLIVLNIGEDAVAEQEKTATEGRLKHDARGTRTTAVCAKLEAELAELPADEADEFRREMGAPEGGTHRVLEQARELLGLVTFFTAGEQDTHAWTVPEGATALIAAGRIHSDIARGFIRAEVITWDKLLEHKTHAEARKHAALRQEGKAYIVQEGDVINVLFNV